MKKNPTLIRTALFAAFSMMAGTAFSQSTLNVAGHSAKINGMTFDYSIGEMTVVSTAHSGNLIVTQGLLQPIGSGSGANADPGNTTMNDLADQIKVYPNPTDNILFIETLETLNADFSYQLFDATGKVVLSRTEQQKAGANKFSLDLHALAQGSYYLMIRKPGKDGNAQTYSFKIQKMN
ncbi:MAG: T9SS type A sorting domain-containing protein [Chitinophagaceae bacterium]|nr:T9SS type A sorting domain-containing protein [Chitinophagaceae bacterium]